MDPALEKNLKDIGLHKIIGVDEVGRGAGSGPVVVAAVMLPTNHRIVGIKDSKKLSPKKRKELSQLIHEQAIELHIARADHVIIDKINILEATKLCMWQVVNKFSVRPDMVVIDGQFDFKDFDFKYSYYCEPKADENYESVSASSIVAKVHRDEYMNEQHKLYPEYGFINHHGYLTKEHVAAIKKYGPCPIHRRTFNPLRTLLSKGAVKDCV